MPESYKEDGRPAQQWYWDDWFSAFDVRLCSLAARGLWIDMLGIMFKAEIRGTLTINGKKISSKTIAKITGGSIANIERLLKELERHDVFSRLEDDTIICRRMFRESGRKDQISKIRSEVGKKGAGKRWQKITNIATATPSSTSTATATPSSTPKKENKESLCLEKFQDEDIKLTQLLIDKMTENDPNSSILRRLTSKRQEVWINECRLLREKDERTPEQIEQIIIFSQGDSFWKANILSMPKLREKFDQLWLKAKKEKFAGIKEWLNEP